MPKGLFTQSAVILLSAPVTADALKAALSAFKIGKTITAKPNSDWMGGSLSMTLIMREEVNGLAVIDLVNKPWPDSMGDPKGTPEAQSIFGAWVMGHFGPNVYPGNLKRILEQDRINDKLKAAAQNHTAILRIKTSYVLGGDPNAKILPQDYDPTSELRFVTAVVAALLKLPQALAYFNPNGEILYDAAGLDAEQKQYAALKLTPLPIWSAVRLYNVDSDWQLMDSVGMDQLLVRDNEACFSLKKHSPDDVSRFLWNIGDYLRQNGPVIKDGDTMNGPGNVNWQALDSAESLCEPPRATLRWFPLDGTRAPQSLIPKENA